MRNTLFALSVILVPVLLYGCFGGEDNKNQTAAVETVKVDLDQYSKLGKQYADSAQKMLGMNLKKALGEGGAIGALNFCSISAIPITDSAAKIMDVKLQRVSDKPRNPMNTADIDELSIIGEMKSAHERGDAIKAKMIQNGDLVTGYYPIVMQSFCLQCHGMPEKEINPETAAVIAQLYPVDKATGYKEGDLRGMWKVTMTDL